jgi:transcription elongation GreA/GreB family factor
MSILNKKIVYQNVCNEVNLRIKNLKTILQEMFDAASRNDSKNSAGDKHETGVAMAQLEQEKLTKQINELLTIQEHLQKINPSIAHNKIGLGSLVETNNGWYYFSVGIGTINMESLSIFAINPKAPIGELLLGKTKGESVLFNGKSTEILSIQ